MSEEESQDQLSPIGNQIVRIARELLPPGMTLPGLPTKPIATGTGTATLSIPTQITTPALPTGSSRPTALPNRLQMVMLQSKLPAITSSREEPERQRHITNVSVLVTRLLAHYWAETDHPATRQAQIEDWIEDLVEFPIECVEEACKSWRRTQTRRPTPFEVRSLATAAQVATHPRLEAPRSAAMTPEQILERCEEIYGTCPFRWEQRGFICFAECRGKIPGYCPHAELSGDS
jgi:hypothetical protein